MKIENPNAVRRNVQEWPVSKNWSSAQTSLLPVLAIGGLGATDSQWDALRSALAFRDVSLASADHRPMCGTIEDLVEHHIEKLDGLGEPTIIIAHSMGALIAPHLAEQRPKLVAGIINIAPVPPADMHLPWSCISRMLAPRYLKAVVTGRLVELTAKDKAFLQDGSSVELAPISGRVLPQLGLGHECPSIKGKCPAATAYAIDDGVIPLVLARRIAVFHSYVGVTEFLELPAGGHFVFAGTHQESMHRLVNFIDRCVREWSSDWSAL